MYFWSKIKEENRFIVMNCMRGIDQYLMQTVQKNASIFLPTTKTDWNCFLRVPEKSSPAHSQKVTLELPKS